jgi:hypothetical protein
LETANDALQAALSGIHAQSPEFMLSWAQVFEGKFWIR